MGQLGYSADRSRSGARAQCVSVCQVSGHGIRRHADRVLSVVTNRNPSRRRRLGGPDNCESMVGACRDVGRSPGNTVDGVEGRRLIVLVVAPANYVARARLDRAAVKLTRRDGGRGAEYAVDGVGGRRPAVAVVAPADDDIRARLDRAAVLVAHRDVGRGP